MLVLINILHYYYIICMLSLLLLYILYILYTCAFCMRQLHIDLLQHRFVYARSESDSRMEQNWCVPLTRQFCTDLKQLNKEVLPYTKHTCSLTSAVELIGSLLNGLGSNAVGIEKCAEHVSVSLKGVLNLHTEFMISLCHYWMKTQRYTAIHRIAIW